MVKTNRAKLNKKAIAELFKIIPRLKNPQQAEDFLQDLMSSSEIKDLARRLMAVRRLYERKTYQEIQLEFGMNPSTINKMHFKTRGSKILPELLK